MSLSGVNGIGVRCDNGHSSSRPPVSAGIVEHDRVRSGALAMPGYTLKIQAGQETHRRWVDTAENEPLTFDVVVAECNAMRDAGYVADGYV